MENVLTLIAPVEGPALTHARLRTASAALRDLGGQVGEVDWLQDGVAADLRFQGVTCERAESVGRSVLGRTGGDVAAQPTRNRRKRLLVADMDSTIIGQECLDELADHAGLGPRIADLTGRAMAGAINFAEALRERVMLFEGLRTEDLQRVFDDRVRLSPGAGVLVQTMRRNGAVTALVSGGFRFFTARVAEAAGFEHYNGNRFEILDGVLTGRIDGGIAGADAKLAMLMTLAAERGLQPRDAIAVGDGANDAAMLRAAGLGVAYRAKRPARDAANAAVDFGDLTAVLFLQGYHRSEFVP